jgi:murein DD-endopeptidase MepM/ murein hydrolase activator NlpD
MMMMMVVAPITGKTLGLTDTRALLLAQNAASANTLNPGAEGGQGGARAISLVDSTINEANSLANTLNTYGQAQQQAMQQQQALQQQQQQQYLLQAQYQTQLLQQQQAMLPALGLQSGGLPQLQGLAGGAGLPQVAALGGNPYFSPTFDINRIYQQMAQQPAAAPSLSPQVGRNYALPLVTPANNATTPAASGEAATTPFVTEKFTVYSGGKPVNNAKDVNIHHDGPAYKKEQVNGKAEQVRDDGGIKRLSKDLVLETKAHGQAAPLGSPVNGKVRIKNEGAGKGYGNYVEILNDQGQVLARVAHLKSIAEGLKDGQVVKAGQLLGIQGTTGRSTGVHLHLELPPDAWEDYFNALKTGDWSKLQSKTA